MNCFKSITGKQTVMSVIIPVYNGERYLKAAIESVLKQPCQEFEVIVVDDGSTDKSGEIADKIAAKYACIRVIHTENCGVSHARNTGIEAATGDYIAFLDADDVLCKDAYNDQIFEILKQNEYDLVSLSYIQGSEDLFRGTYFNVDNAIYRKNEQIVQQDIFKHFSSFLYRHNLFRCNCNIRFFENIHIREDCTFLYQILEHSNSLYSLNHKWFIYRNNSNSILHSLLDYEYIINECIPAWSICKQKSIHTTGKIGCDIWIFAETIEYIQLSCRNGIALKHIKKALEIPEFQDSLANYDILWSSKKEIYHEFLFRPRWFWLKNRAYGIIVNAVRWPARIPIFRQQYFKMRYKNRIESYVCI